MVFDDDESERGVGAKAIEIGMNGREVSFGHITLK
jgi:hypothetical protein